MRRSVILAATVGVLAAVLPAVPIMSAQAAVSAGAPATASATVVAATAVPRPDHIVVVVEENHSYASIIGNTAQAPYLNSLVGQGALFTQSFGVSHPSEPNYLALYSGSTHGLTTDSCPHAYTTANLGQEVIAAGLTFAGYSESMPSNGYTGCISGTYARKHNPWANYTNVPAADNLTFAAFPTNYATLPTVSIVVPNLQNDMHDGTIATGDTWLQSNLDGYAQWAKAHNSLLIVTWDEDDSISGNQVATIFVGQRVAHGSYAEHINHYNVLRTIEDAYALPYAGSSATATPITDAWTGGGTGSVSVTTPPAQSGTVGVATSLQIQATDTAGGTLSYVATGLPAGLSINASTGLISGTPTTAGTSTVGITATDSTGPAGSAAFSWTVATAGGGCTATQLLGNPGFETGAAAPWTASAGVISNSASEPPHSGSWDAWLDGYGTTTTNTLSQPVTLPAGCATYTFTFWLHINTAETTTTTAYDTLNVQVLSSSGSVLGTLASYSNLNAASGYTQRTFSLAAYAGTTVTLRLTGTEDSSLQTSFVVDDAAVNIG